jgi:hypothetical protein
VHLPKVLQKKPNKTTLHTLIYPKEFEVKNTTDTQKSASNHDLYLEIYNRERIKTKLQ